MTTKNDGGPAFPIPTGESAHEWNPCQFGMTLRDYFAAQALVTAPFNLQEVKANAEWAYQMADAMLKARGE